MKRPYLPSRSVRRSQPHLRVAIFWLLLTSATHVLLSRSPAAAAPRPNIVVLVSDDAGYADFSFQGSRQIATPHLDAIRQGGVLCQAGYVTAS
ncbi:MAG: sulfatase, partial [Planctomycetaceae bacterium]|nr:sulfatase [Planctomycetaceae bacterium]